MDKEIELLQLQQAIRELVNKFNISEPDNDILKRYSNDLFNSDRVLAQKIITGDIDDKLLKLQFDKMNINEDESVNALEEIEPFWDEGEV